MNLLKDSNFFSLLFPEISVGIWKRVAIFKKYLSNIWSCGTRIFGITSSSGSRQKGPTFSSANLRTIETGIPLKIPTPTNEDISLKLFTVPRICKLDWQGKQFEKWNRKLRRNARKCKNYIPSMVSGWFFGQR